MQKDNVEDEMKDKTPPYKLNTGCTEWRENEDKKEVMIRSWSKNGKNYKINSGVRTDKDLESFDKREIELKIKCNLQDIKKGNLDNASLLGATSCNDMKQLTYAFDCWNTLKTLTRKNENNSTFYERECRKKDNIIKNLNSIIQKIIDQEDEEKYIEVVSGNFDRLRIKNQLDRAMNDNRLGNDPFSTPSENNSKKELDIPKISLKSDKDIPFMTTKIPTNDAPLIPSNRHENVNLNEANSEDGNCMDFMNADF